MKKSVLALLFALLFALGCACAEQVEVDYGQQLKEAAVIQFADELPQVLSPILAHPHLEGWSVLCGAYYHYAPTPDFSIENSLIAFEKADERLLVQALRNDGDTEWTLHPFGTQALRPAGTLYITCNPKDRCFSIVYPLSETEEICFETYANVHTLKNYTFKNRETGEELKAVPGMPGREALLLGVTGADGQLQELRLEKHMHNQLSRIDASAFPTTLEEWKALPSVEPPKGYGVACGVHLRAQTSSRSKDLGDYHTGVLVEILGEEDGDPYNWYRVRIGRMEGYMASIYVDYEGSPCTTHPLTNHDPLPVAETTKAANLKSGTGLFAKTIQELPVGTRMHVLAERGRWLHVMIPQNEIGWMMDVNGTDGYVLASDVRTASSALQLDWMQ